MVTGFVASKFFNDLRQINKILSIYTCTGEVLEERLEERGMARNPEKDTKAKYYVEFEGAEPSIGARRWLRRILFYTRKTG